jgi:hypothetical protein
MELRRICVRLAGAAAVAACAPAPAVCPEVPVPAEVQSLEHPEPKCRDEVAPRAATPAAGPPAARGSAAGTLAGGHGQRRPRPW